MPIISNKLVQGTTLVTIWKVKETTPGAMLVVASVVHLWLITVRSWKIQLGRSRSSLAIGIVGME